MTSPFLLAPDECLVERVRATYYVTRMIAQTGQIGLTDRRLLFAPTGRLEKALGTGYPLSVPIQEVQRLQGEGSGPRRMVVRTAIQSYRFVGRGLGAIEQRISEAMKARGPDSGETVIATVKMHLYVSRLLTQSGTLFLTNRQLSFVPIGLLDRVVGARAIAMPVQEVVGISRAKGVAPRCALEGVQRKLLFLGDLPPVFLERLRGVLADSGRILEELGPLRDPHTSPGEPEGR